jgi:hypothetical protein
MTLVHYTATSHMFIKKSAKQQVQRWQGHLSLLLD